MSLYLQCSSGSTPEKLSHGDDQQIGMSSSSWAQLFQVDALSSVGSQSSRRSSMVSPVNMSTGGGGGGGPYPSDEA